MEIIRICPLSARNFMNLKLAWLMEMCRKEDRVFVVRRKGIEFVVTAGGLIGCNYEHFDDALERAEMKK